MALKLWPRSPLQWHDLPADFHENLPVSSKFIRLEHKHCLYYIYTFDSYIKFMHINIHL
jgi:hypothetical protein